MTFKKHLTLQTMLVGATLVFASAAFVAMPLSNIAIAKNGGGNGGGHGNGGGNGGGKGGGNGGGNSGGHGNSGGNASGHAANDANKTNNGQHNGTKNTTPGAQPTASQLGKLNGFMHASPQALKNASPNSTPGAIGQTFHDMLNDYAAQQDPADPNAVSIDDLADVLADASNKKMSPDIVKEVLDRLTEVYGDDYSSLSDDEATDGTSGDTSSEEPEPKSFAQDLSDRVNEINGYSGAADEEQDPS